MVPSAFVRLDTFPLTPNGKIDRQALPVPEWRAEAAYVAPQTSTQAGLAAVWAEVLGLERVWVFMMISLTWGAFAAGDSTYHQNPGRLPGRSTLAPFV